MSFERRHNLCSTINLEATLPLRQLDAVGILRAHVQLLGQLLSP